MQEIRVNLTECYEKFQLIALASSCYQKKSGEIVVPKDGLMRDFVTKFPDLPMVFGDAVAIYGNCPYIAYTIRASRYPTKIMSFPITPTSLRVKEPEKIVIARLAKRFKPYTLLPGWLLRPRIDMVEFSCYKFAEVIKFYKLENVALAVDTLGLGDGDEKYYELVKDIFMKYLNHLPVSLCYLPKQEAKKIAAQETVQVVSNSSYVEDISDEEIEVPDPI